MIPVSTLGYFFFFFLYLTVLDLNVRTRVCVCLCVSRVSIQKSKWDASRSMRYNQDAQREEGIAVIFWYLYSAKYHILQIQDTVYV